MMKHGSRILAAAASLACSIGIAHAEDLWSLYDPACNANGIDPERCRCILGEVVKAHGESAARYVGLDMTLQYDELIALLDEIGEDEAFAAGDTFDVAQNTICRPRPAASTTGNGPASITGSATEAATASD